MLISPYAVAVGWGTILARTGRAIYEDDCLGWAAELAYYWFLALFPALLFGVALASYIPRENLMFKGSVGMFLRAGFKVHRDMGKFLVVRKNL